MIPTFREALNKLLSFYLDEQDADPAVIQRELEDAVVHARELNAAAKAP